jgi:starvation-inducible DNA-binding protein
MHPTKNDLSEKLRQQAANDLNALLADVTDLTLQAKQAHWNVKGSNFIALHKLFDDVYGHAGEWADDIAERIVALGGDAHGTLQAAAKATRLQPWPLETHGEKAYVERLAAALGQFGSSVRTSIDAFTALGDAGTADLVTGISREVDKDLWFVEAHLQG